MCKMREDFEEWECNADNGPLTDPMWLMRDPCSPDNYGIAQVQHNWQVWQAACTHRVAEEAEVEDFFERYNSAINNPAPDDDGGTTSYELERLLDEAVLLLEKLA